MQSILRVILIALALGCLSCRSSGSVAPGGTPPGEFVQLLSGGRITFDSLKGKVVLVNFWASWCSPCVDEMPALERIQRELGKNFVVLAIGVDDPQENLNRFAADNGLSLLLGVDKDGRLKRLFRVTGLPESFIMNKQGKFVMFNDPSDNFPVVRIVGPRNWESSSVLAQLRALVNP